MEYIRLRKFHTRKLLITLETLNIILDRYVYDRKFRKKLPLSSEKLALTLAMVESSFWFRVSQVAFIFIAARE